MTVNDILQSSSDTAKS